MSDVRLNKAFREWFGDSVVRNTDGSPMVVYHGTTHEFTEFDPSRIASGGGFYFTDSAYLAEDFGDIIDAFIKIERPFRTTYRKWLKGSLPSFEILSKRGHDGVIVEGFCSSDEVCSDDGVMFVVFSPEQIKSIENAGTWDPSDPNIMRNPRSKERKLPRWMNSTRSMWNWADRNVGDFGSEMEDEPPEVRRLFRDQMEEQFGDYWGIADTARWKGFADIYRVISVAESCLGDPEKMLGCVDMEEIGHYWSAEKSGAGSYGKRSSGGVDILLRGTVAFEDIDWEHGFTSFCYYPDQLEIAVKHNANIVLTGIEGHKIDPPVVVNSGSAEGYVHRSQ